MSATAAMLYDASETLAEYAAGLRATEIAAGQKAGQSQSFLNAAARCALVARVFEAAAKDKAK